MLVFYYRRLSVGQQSPTEETFALSILQAHPRLYLLVEYDNSVGAKLDRLDVIEATEIVSKYKDIIAGRPIEVKLGSNILTASIIAISDQRIFLETKLNEMRRSRNERLPNSPKKEHQYESNNKRLKANSPEVVNLTTNNSKLLSLAWSSSRELGKTFGISEHDTMLIEQEMQSNSRSYWNTSAENKGNLSSFQNRHSIAGPSLSARNKSHVLIRNESTNPVLNNQLPLRHRSMSRSSDQQIRIHSSQRRSPESPDYKYDSTTGSLRLSITNHASNNQSNLPLMLRNASPAPIQTLRKRHQFADEPLQQDTNHTHKKQSPECLNTGRSTSRVEMTPDCFKINKSNNINNKGQTANDANRASTASVSTPVALLSAGANIVNYPQIAYVKPMTFDQQTQTEYGPTLDSTLTDFNTQKISDILVYQEGLQIEQKNIASDFRNVRIDISNLYEEFQSIKTLLMDMQQKLDNQSNAAITPHSPIRNETGSGENMLLTPLQIAENTSDNPVVLYTCHGSNSPNSSNNNLLNLSTSHMNNVTIENIEINENSNVSGITTHNGSRLSIVSNKSRSNGNISSHDLSTSSGSGNVFNNSSMFEERHQKPQKIQTRKIKEMVKHDWSNAAEETAEHEEDCVVIGKYGTKVSTYVMDQIKWQSYSCATRKLLITLFKRDVLASHSLTGKPSPGIYIRYF